MAKIKKYGFKFFIPKKEEFIIEDCMDQIKKTIDYKKPPKSILDIGSHIGAFAILAKHVDVVYAFEPFQ